MHQFLKMEIDGSDIGAVIGPGGKVIQTLQKEILVLKLSLKKMTKEKVLLLSLQMILQKRKMRKTA